MSALRMEKELADTSTSLTKSTLGSRGTTAFHIPRKVTGLVTVNGNNLKAKGRGCKIEDRFPRGFNQPRLTLNLLV